MLPRAAHHEFIICRFNQQKAAGGAKTTPVKTTVKHALQIKLVFL